MANLTPMIGLGHNTCWIVTVADVRQITGDGVPCMVVNESKLCTACAREANNIHNVEAMEGVARR